MILILTQCFPSRVGGVESLIGNLALALSEEEKIIVFADRNNIIYDTAYDNQHKDKILVKRTGGFKFFRRRKKVKEIKHFIESNQVKLAIADSWKSFELSIDYLNANKIHTICLSHGNELISNSTKKFFLIKSILNKVSAIVANSSFTKELVKKYVESNVRISVIYPGAADIRKIGKSKILNITGSPILLTLSRLEKRKGHSYIIGTIHRLISNFPNLQYIIAGVGPEFNKLKKIVKEKKLQKHVIFIGKINDFEKRYLFEKTHLMVMPTLDESQNRSIEGFGIVYLEASFFSIPSIASNIGGTPEAVINNFTGIIINKIEDLYISINNLLNDEKKIKNFGVNAQKRAIKEFNWTYISKKYFSLINDIINKN